MNNLSYLVDTTVSPNRGLWDAGRRECVQWASSGSRWGV